MVGGAGSEFDESACWPYISSKSQAELRDVSGVWWKQRKARRHGAVSGRLNLFNESGPPSACIILFLVAARAVIASSELCLVCIIKEFR